jgi:uncharacterized protein YbjT (DUF2867 family)
MSWVLAICTLALGALAAPAFAKPENVLVFGGSGQLGAEIVRALVAQGHKVSIFVRPSSKLDRLQGVAFGQVQGDVLVEADVVKALKSGKFSVVVDALARGRSQGGGRSMESMRSDTEFYEISERYISKAAKAAGVRQIILHSSVGAGDSRPAYPASRLAAMAPVLDAKAAGEKHVMDSGVTYTIIRNAILRNAKPGDADYAKLVEDKTKFGMVTRTELARLTADCIGNKACANKIYTAVDETMGLPAELRE